MIKVFGIVNPNREEGKFKTGKFGIALLNETDVYTSIEADFNIDGISVSLAPEGISFV